MTVACAGCVCIMETIFSVKRSYIPFLEGSEVDGKANRGSLVLARGCQGEKVIGPLIIFSIKMRSNLVIKSSAW